MPFEWDEWAMQALVGIDPDEVRQVCGGKRRWPRPAVGPSGVRVLTIWGRTVDSRPLIVAVRHLDDTTWKIIGARDLSATELDELARWEEER